MPPGLCLLTCIRARLEWDPSIVGNAAAETAKCSSNVPYANVNTHPESTPAQMSKETRLTALFAK